MHQTNLQYFIEHLFQNVTHSLKKTLDVFKSDKRARYIVRSKGEKVQSRNDVSVVCLPRNWLRKFYSFIDNWNISQVLTRYVPIETWYVRLIIYFEQNVRPFELRNIYEERCLLHVASPAALVA